MAPSPTLWLDEAGLCPSPKAELGWVMPPPLLPGPSWRPLKAPSLPLWGWVKLPSPHGTGLGLSYASSLLQGAGWDRPHPFPHRTRPCTFPFLIKARWEPGCSTPLHAARWGPVTTGWCQIWYADGVGIAHAAHWLKS